MFATCRARSRRTGRGDRASWAGRRARHLGVAPYRRRRSEHNPQAYGLAGSRGGVGRCDTRHSRHTLWRCGLFRKYVSTHTSRVSPTRRPADPIPIRRPSNAHGRQRHRRGTDIRNEYARHHSVAESPLARRNLLSDDAAHVRASRYATTARPAPWRERCGCAPRRGGRIMDREHGWAVLGPWKWKLTD